MADIKSKNELKRRIDLFLDDEIDYSINKEFCMETMRMMKEFIGHASHRIDCAESKIKSFQNKLKQFKDKQEQRKVCPRCGFFADHCVCESKPQTNADRIRSMTDAELAQFLRETVSESGDNLFLCDDYTGSPECKEKPCSECGVYLKWLQSEAKE